MLGDTEVPLNEAGIRALKDRAREIDAGARSRPGKTLKERRLPEEQAELDKMLAGELYDPMDPELVRARVRARDLCQDLNATREAQMMSH